MPLLVNARSDVNEPHWVGSTRMKDAIDAGHAGIVQILAAVGARVAPRPDDDDDDDDDAEIGGLYQHIWASDVAAEHHAVRSCGICTTTGMPTGDCSRLRRAGRKRHECSRRQDTDIS